LLGLVWC